MQFVIAKEVHGFTIREWNWRGEIGNAKIWAYDNLEGALGGLNRLYNPPILVPEGTIVLGKKK